MGLLEAAAVWLLTRLFHRRDIGRQGDVYITRWTLWDRGGRHVYVHLFHRGDTEDYDHDHPWPYWSLILAGGYWEESELYPRPRWFGPGRLLRRPAVWRHRVKLPEGRRCWTLVGTGRKERSWGFWCPQGGWVHWTRHKLDLDAGGTGCSDA